MSDVPKIFYRTDAGTAGAFETYRTGPEPYVDDITYFARGVGRYSEESIKHIIRAKKIFDIIIASLALILAAPILLMAAVLIKLESRGPVLFTQERIGLNRRRGDRRSIFRVIDGERRKADRRRSTHAGRPFRIYKLRTMVIDAEKEGPALACRNDSRTTRVGRLLRKARIDEIPQFINVILGDMSFIGPRPERSFYINKIKQELPEFPLRLVLKPGLTGLAQVEDGYAQTLDRMRDKLFFDLKYIAEMSILQELKIFCKTFLVVLTGKGAC